MDFTPFLWTLIWNIIIAIWIISVVLVVKYIKDRFLNYIDFITAITVWLLLGIIFFGFIPEIVEEWLEGETIGLFILIWIFLFYLLELFLHWHHCKDLWWEQVVDSHLHHEHKNGILMFWGTLLHNAFHWVVLFSAFSVNVSFWIATTFAILLHSIPQNVVNYVMNHNKAIYAYIWAFAWVFWALLTFPFSDFLVDHEAYVLAIIAWWLLYTALADIIPEFKGKWTTVNKLSYLVFILIWIFIFLGFEQISGHGHENENNIEHECEEHWWFWIEEAYECEWINRETCNELGGNFNECASACRNDPEAEICTLQCVQVCEFNK